VCKCLYSWIRLRCDLCSLLVVATKELFNYLQICSNFCKFKLARLYIYSFRSLAFTIVTCKPYLIEFVYLWWQVKCKEKETVKSLWPTIWLTEGFPLKIEEIYLSWIFCRMGCMQSGAYGNCSLTSSLLGHFQLRYISFRASLKIYIFFLFLFIYSNLQILFAV
jgi:hypothetical protein